MAKHVCIVMMLAVATVIPAHAQSDDFGIWTEASIEKKLSKKLTIDADAELRTRDDGFGEIDRWSVGIGASYKLTKWLKASVGYALLDDNNHKLNDKQTKYADYWGLRHRLNVSLTASQDFGDLTVSLRERWQYTYRPEKTVKRYSNVDNDDYDFGEYRDDHTYAGKGSNKWRNRLQLKYKLTKQWRPFVNAESTIGGSGLDKMRYALGTEYRLSKQHSFELRYLYQHVYKDDTEGNCHVLGIGYSYSF
jgi:long-subunit fatty acid transport protein